MNLGARLRSVAVRVDPFLSVADIGSDHAYLPVWLVKNDKIQFAVAVEVQPGPWKAAKRSVLEAALEGRISVRLGDGLTVVEPGEVEVAVLAGMGGAAIRNILDRSPVVVSSLRRIVCQPMTGADILRRWFAENGWKLVAEDLVLEDDHLYEVFAAEPGHICIQHELLLEIGPLLWEQRHPLLFQHLMRLKRQYIKRVEQMGQSGSAIVGERQRGCQKKIDELEERMKCLLTAEKSFR